VREILIAGLGSMGLRHLTNLRALGWRQIRLFRTGRSTLPQAVLAAVRADPDLAIDHDLAAALARHPVAVIVSNPSALHMPVALESAHAGAHVFVEKPLSSDLAGVSELEHVVRAHRLAAIVGFHFRFNPGLRQIKRWIDAGAIGAVVSVQAHWGESLRDMHPWEDYRVGYAARRTLGGGVLLTLCHPFDYLRWLLGDIEHVSAVESHHDSLGLCVDTSVEVGLRFVSGASGHVHLDFFQRPRDHRLTIIGTEGALMWNDDDHEARRSRGSSRSGTRGWETVSAPEGFERNEMYLDEMRHFLACVRGEEQPLCTLGDGKAALEISLAARRDIARSGDLFPEALYTPGLAACVDDAAVSAQVP
jgi:predicted dehydrogenase